MRLSPPPSGPKATAGWGPLFFAADSIVQGIVRFRGGATEAASGGGLEWQPWRIRPRGERSGDASGDTTGRGSPRSESVLDAIGDGDGNLAFGQGTTKESGREAMKQFLRSVCALDCPDTCSLKITVDQGRVLDLQGDPEHPMTQGFACVKTARYPERQEHPDRLQVPMRRVGRKGEGHFVPATWEEALDTIADRTKQILDRHGGQSILPYHYAGTMGLLEGSYPLTFFRAIGALELDQTICASTGGAAWEANYGPAKVGPPPEDLVEARCIILWGIHLLRSNSHLAPILKEARRRGARILHIDPYRNETSRFADEHWSVRVGSDAALALGWANALIEQGLIDQTYIDRYAEGWDEFREACSAWPLERTARYCHIPIDSLGRWIELYGKSACSFIKVGYGMTRNEGGGNALRAITLLPAITGAWKKRGGGAVLSTSGAFALHRHQATGLHLLRPEVRHVNMNRLASELLADPVTIRGLFIFTATPLPSRPIPPVSARGWVGRTFSPWCWSIFKPTLPTTPTGCCPRRHSSNIPTSTRPMGTTICNGPIPWSRLVDKPVPTVGSFNS